jgi:peptidoglycan hydrolase CwlO-like protein
MLESVRNENSVKEALAKELKKEREHKDNKVHDTQKARTPFQEHLEKMQIGDSTLNEYLSDTSKLPPYMDKKLHKLADDLSDGKERIEALLELAGEKFEEKQLGDKEYFYEYWHWVFRYARKNAVKKRGGN